MTPTSVVHDQLARNAPFIRERFGVVRIGLFGSQERGSASPSSDVDVLVEFIRPTFDEYMDLKFYLEDLFGRRVDLVVADSIKPALRDAILSEVTYVA